MAENTERWHIFFDGHVQGVGFRFAAQIFAAGLGLTGWGRNKEDGRVEMEAQGSAADLQKLVDRLKSRPPILITECDIRKIPLKDGEKKFSVLSSF